MIDALLQNDVGCKEYQQPVGDGTGKVDDCVPKVVLVPATATAINSVIFNYDGSFYPPSLSPNIISALVARVKGVSGRSQRYNADPDLGWSDDMWVLQPDIKRKLELVGEALKWCQRPRGQNDAGNKGREDREEIGPEFLRYKYQLTISPRTSSSLNASAS